MAGMAGLHTAHRYGNATLLESDFVLGIGNRWANRWTGGLDVFRAGAYLRARRHRAHPDRPGVRARLRHRLGRQGRAGAVRRGRERTPDQAGPAGLRGLGEGLPAAQVDDASPHQLRQRADQAAAGLSGDEQGVRPRHHLRLHDRLVADRRRPVPARLRPPPLDQRWPGRPARLDPAGRARRTSCGARRGGGGVVRRLRLPVHDRGAGRRRAVQAALHPRAGEQRLPRLDSAVPARLRYGLRSVAVIRQ